MGFDGLSRYKKIEDPEPREPKDIARKGKFKAAYKRSSKGRTVSLSTAKRTGTFITAAIWLAFIFGLIYLLYIVLGTYTN